MRASVATLSLMTLGVVLTAATTSAEAARPTEAVVCSSQPSKPCGWTIAWRTEGTTLDSSGSTLRISNKGDGVGFLELARHLGRPDGLQIIRYGAIIKPEAVAGKGAGLTLTFLSKSGEMLASHDMGYGDFGMAQGAGPFRRAEIVAAAPIGTDQVKLGLILYGSGTALFKQVTFASRPVGHGCSRFAQSSVQAAVRIMRVHGLAREKVDFRKLAAQGCAIAGQARTPQQIYPAMRFMVDQLGDHHSFFFSREEIAHWKGEDKSPDGSGERPAMPIVRALGKFGYVKVPGLHSDKRAAKIAFAQAIQDGLRDLSNRDAKGWIVDLRDNDGGNMFPMLAGLAPLFDQSRLGYLVDADGKRDAWGVGPDGPAPNEAEYIPLAHPVRLTRPLPIAVLFGPRTGSSGEIVILSFVGNKLTRSFGQPSFGLTTGNGIFPLSDGSELRLASTHMADRTGRTYSGALKPDVEVDIKSSDGNDPVLQAASKWLDSLNGPAQTSMAATQVRR